VRVSLGLHNTREDLDRLIDVLLRIARGEYVLDKSTGLFCPRDFDLEVTFRFSL